MLIPFIFALLVLSSLTLILLVSGNMSNNDNTVDGYNINTVHRDNGDNIADLKFITVGDPQIDINTLDGIDRLKKVVSFVNKSDVDFVVFEGDMTNDGGNVSNDVVIDILEDLNKPYYVIVGNHDMYVDPKIFESHYGKAEHVEYIKGYQLLFIGIGDKKINNDFATKLNWSFDFSKIDKNIPTLVFIHGPVIDMPAGCLHCMVRKDIMKYGNSIRPELEKFVNLVGVYSGHVHYDSNRLIDKTRYVTVNGLVNVTVMGITIANPSDNVGYTVVHGDKSYYDLVSYV